MGILKIFYIKIEHNRDDYSGWYLVAERDSASAISTILQLDTPDPYPTDMEPLTAQIQPDSTIAVPCDLCTPGLQCYELGSAHDALHPGLIISSIQENAPDAKIIGASIASPNEALTPQIF